MHGGWVGAHRVWIDVLVLGALGIAVMFEYFAIIYIVNHSSDSHSTTPVTTKVLKSLKYYHILTLELLFDVASYAP